MNSPEATAGNQKNKCKLSTYPGIVWGGNSICVARDYSICFPY